MLLIITHSSDELFSSVNIGDLEWLWIFEIEGFSAFLQCLAAAHISRVNLHAEITTDRPGQTAYKISSIWRIFLTIWVSTFYVEGVFRTKASNFGISPRRIIILLHFTLIARVAGPMLSHVTWALLKSLVQCAAVVGFCFQYGAVNNQTTLQQDWSEKNRSR